MNKKRVRSEIITAWIFVIPALLLLILYNVYPVIYSFYISLTEWSGGVGTDPIFVGFSNYIEIFDPSTQVGRTFL